MGGGCLVLTIQLDSAVPSMMRTFDFNISHRLSTSVMLRCHEFRIAFSNCVRTRST